DAFAERVAVHAPVIHLGAGEPRPAGVEVDAHENRVTVAVHDPDAVIEFHKPVGTPREDGAHAAAEFSPDALHHVQREVLFPLPCHAAGCAGILAAMPGVEDDGGKPARTGTMSPLIA